MAIEQNGGHKFKKTIKNFFTFAPDLEEIKKQLDYEDRICNGQ